MKDKSIVTIKDLQIKYGNNVILNNINLNIKKGEIVGLLGPSGSGKTTLVKGIIGMVEASKGSINVIETAMPSLEVVSKIGYMAQSDALYNDLSAIDNLLFFGELYNVKGEEAVKKANKLLELIDLTSSKKKLVKNFSGGMKRRLSLGIALMHSPDILILDEPTTGIDPVLRKSFWDEFKRIKEEGGTIIVTTHVMDEAAKCDRLYLIRDGEVIASGSPKDLIEMANGESVEDAFLYFSGKKEE